MNTFESQTDLTASKVVYEAPCIETVLTAQELEREVAYAGVVVQVSVGVGVGVGGGLIP